MRQILPIIFLIAVISGCAGSRQNKMKQDADGVAQAINGHNARNALDYQGTYVGTILLQDSDLVNLVVTLNANDFVFRLTPMEEHAETIEKKGKYSWDESGFIITLHGVRDLLSRCFVGENHLRLLSSGDRQSDNQNAGSYILYKRW